MVIKCTVLRHKQPQGIKLYIWNNSDDSINYESTRQVIGTNVTEEWNVSLGFENYTWNCYAENNYHENLILDKDKLRFEFKNGNIEGDFFELNSKEKKELELVPMGNTVLRRVTFPVQ